MPELPPEPDKCQNDIGQRNRKLANLLLGVWNSENIKKISRDPEPKAAPQPNDPPDGKWKAETV